MQQVTEKPPTVVPPDLRRRLQNLVDTVGVVRAAAQLGVSRQTLACALAGLSMQPGSIYQLEARAPK